VDIPDARKKDQDAIRYILKKAQFIQIKPSVWISPYPLEHMMINIKADMGLDSDIMVLVTDKLDAMTEQMLINRFNEKQEF
jgi:DNA-binding transcriptional regulator PaaX